MAGELDDLREQLAQERRVVRLLARELGGAETRIRSLERQLAVSQSMRTALAEALIRAEAERLAPNRFVGMDRLGSSGI